MTTSPTAILSKPQAGVRISPEALGYMRARAKRHAYDLVMAEFKKSGITKAELARRLFGDRGADRVSRMLGGPGNWTIKTVSDLLFAISAAEPNYSIDYPLDRPARNFGPRQRFYEKRELKVAPATTAAQSLTLKTIDPTARFTRGL